MPQKSFKPLGYDKNDNNACQTGQCVENTSDDAEMHNFKKQTEPGILIRSKWRIYTSG